MDTLFSPSYAIFSVALILVLAIGLMEALGLVVAGAGPASLLEQLLDTDSFPESAATNWLIVKGLPLSAYMVLLLATFGGAGISLQASLSTPMSVAPAAGIALLAAVVLTRVIGKRLTPLFDGHTSAVSEESFIGKTAVLVAPRCTSDLPAEAKVKDSFSKMHSVMVEPEDPMESFVEGETLLLVSRIGRARFTARRSS